MSFSPRLPFNTDEPQSADQVVEFLRNFYDVFPEYKMMDVRINSIHPIPYEFSIRRPTLLARASLANIYPTLASSSLRPFV